RRVDDDARVDPVSARGVDADNTVARRANSNDLDALLDADTAPARGIGVAVGHRCRIAVAGVGLVHDSADARRVDARLQAREISRIEHFGADTDRALTR